MVALLVGLWVLPWHAGEERFPVDHLGGVLSVFGVGGLILVIEHVDKGITASWLVYLVVAGVTLAAFFWRQTRAQRPLVSLPLAKARTFWVAFVAGAITFGSLIGAMFVGQQFTQNVLGYAPFDAALVVLPAAICTALFGQIAGRLIPRFGSQFTFMLGLGAVAAAFTVMLDWRDAGPRRLGAARLRPGRHRRRPRRHPRLPIADVLGAHQSRRAWARPSSTSLVTSGARILQAVMGALLAGAYAASMTATLAALPSDEASKVGNDVADSLTSSFQSASQVAQQYPDYATQITSAAADAFTSGKSAAIAIALVMTLVGMALVLFVYPREAGGGGVLREGARAGVTGNDDVIRTSRLDLHTVRPEEYDLLAANRAHRRLWTDRGFTNPLGHLVTDPGPLPYRIPRIAIDPDAAPYLLRMAVLREEGIVVGSAGFHDRPDADGMIEIGMGVEESYRGRGIAQEMLHGMWSWVIDQPGVVTLRYTVSPGNAPSQAIIRKLGFGYRGQQEDGVDGRRRTSSRCPRRTTAVISSRRPRRAADVGDRRSAMRTTEPARLRSSTPTRRMGHEHSNPTGGNRPGPASGPQRMRWRRRQGRPAGGASPGRCRLGAPAELVDCVMGAMEGLSVEELTAIRDDTASAETEEKVTAAMGDCAVPE